jgi:hypothetical protein
LDPTTCIEVSNTYTDLFIAGKPEDARRAADKLESYGPPDPVKANIEHFVTTVGSQPNDPDLDMNRIPIQNWVLQICPNALKPG